MKKFVVVILMVVLTTPIYSQLAEQCQTIKLGSKQEINDAEICIDQLADYVLSKQLREVEVQKSRAVILAWMEKTPNYTFVINANLMKICKGENVLLFGIYMTSLAKASLTGKEEFNEYALKLLVDYIKTPENNVVKTKEVEKLLLAWENKEYDKYVR